MKLVTGWLCRVSLASTGHQTGASVVFVQLQIRKHLPDARLYCAAIEAVYTAAKHGVGP